jgi:hypothetical protein
MPKPRHIEGRHATRVATEVAMREPVRLLASADAGDKHIVETSSPSAHEVGKRAPPRVKKPSRHTDQVLAPAELGAHKAALREVFGETLSDEFVDVMLTQLVAALRPGPFDVLEEATLNAAIALIASIKPQSELEALIAVQIVATGFTGLKFLQQSQRHLDEAFIGVYGGYGTRLLRLQLELIQSLDKHRRGHNQTVEVRHVHIHPGGQGVVGIINPGKDRGEGGEVAK